MDQSEIDQINKTIKLLEKANVFTRELAEAVADLAEQTNNIAKIQAKYSISKNNSPITCDDPNCNIYECRRDRGQLAIMEKTV